MSEPRPGGCRPITTPRMRREPAEPSVAHSARGCPPHAAKSSCTLTACLVRSSLDRGADISFRRTLEGAEKWACTQGSRARSCSRAPPTRVLASLQGFMPVTHSKAVPAGSDCRLHSSQRPVTGPPGPRIEHTPCGTSAASSSRWSRTWPSCPVWPRPAIPKRARPGPGPRIVWDWAANEWGVRSTPPDGRAPRILGTARGRGEHGPEGLPAPPNQCPRIAHVRFHACIAYF